MSMAQYLAIYVSEKPTLVHHFTLKPVLYGSLAARARRLPAVVNSLTGLGYVFTSEDKLAVTLREVLKPWLRLALGGSSTRVIFQNRGGKDWFVDQGLAPENRSYVIPGSGVNPMVFKPRPEPQGIPVIMMASRMLWDKGVGDLVAAAERLHSQGISARVVLVGDTDPGNPASISESQLRKWSTAGIVEWWGWRSDMQQVLSTCHIVVLPSYGEGLPRALLEAAAVGKPIVATDIPGCREIVHHGKNGLLVPPGDVEALYEALVRLILDQDLRRRMGRCGRKLVLDRFSDEIIIQQTLDVYHELLGTSWAS